MPTPNNPFGTKIFHKEDQKNARKWFKEKLAGLSASDIRSKAMSDIRYRGQLPLVGRMVYYKYRAEGDGKLPYWDMFPLVIMIDESAQHFMGLNLHYLPPNVRGVFLTRLMEVINNANFDKTTKLRLTYDILKGATKFRYFKPCIKKYIKKNIRSNVMIIRSSQWHLAIQLPVAKFKGASESSVWADSKGLYT